MFIFSYIFRCEHGVWQISAESKCDVEVRDSVAGDVNAPLVAQTGPQTITVKWDAPNGCAVGDACSKVRRSHILSLSLTFSLRDTRTQALSHTHTHTLTLSFPFLFVDCPRTHTVIHSPHFYFFFFFFSSSSSSSSSSSFSEKGIEF